MADETKKSLAAGRNERESLPTRRRIMSLLSKAIAPEERGAFRRRFRDASRDDDGSAREFLCKTPIGVVAKAFECEPVQLRLAADMFPEHRIQSRFLNEFYVIDVILNRAPSPAVTGDYKNGRRVTARLLVSTLMSFVLSWRTNREIRTPRKIIYIEL